MTFVIYKCLFRRVANKRPSVQPAFEGAGRTGACSQLCTFQFDASRCKQPSACRGLFTSLFAEIKPFATHTYARSLKKEDGSNEYKILQSHLNAVEVKDEACLSDVLYVDHYTGKRDTVVVRWNNHSIVLPLGVVVKLKESHLLGLTKYSGWAYERESRFCVNAKIDFEKVNIRSYPGWELANDKVALLLKPDIVRSISVLGGPCVDENDLDRLKLLNGGIANDTEIPTQKSLLYGMIRGGVFCKDCPLGDNKKCLVK